MQEDSFTATGDREVPTTTKSIFPPHLVIPSPFSKSQLTSPMSAIDGSETEVGFIFESATRDWPYPASRCSSSDTSKESLFSPSMVGRSRSMSSGSGSRKSPRCFDLCSPSSLCPLPSPLPIVQEEGRESVGCKSLSKKLTDINISDTSSPRPPSSESPKEETLANFFNATQTRPRRGRSDSYCGEYELPVGYSDKGGEVSNQDNSSVECLKNGDVRILQPSLLNSTGGSSTQAGEEAVNRVNTVAPLPSHDYSVFSPLSSGSIFPSSAREPPPPPCSATSRGSVGHRPTRTSRSETVPRALMRATSLDFDNSSTRVFTQQQTRQRYKRNNRINYGSSGSSPRHSSISSKLARNFSAPPPYVPSAPMTPSDTVESLSQQDEYRGNNNPRPSTYNTPKDSASCATSGEDGNDWGMSESALKFELEAFEKIYQLDCDGPRVQETSSKNRGIFSSLTSAFGQKATPACSK